MKFNYHLERLCGAYYGHPTTTRNSQTNGSNVVFTSNGDTLISSVSNRIQIIHLKSQTVKTLPIEARSNISYLALSPDDCLLWVVDVQNYAMLINLHRHVVLQRIAFAKHHFQTKRVRCIQFSHTGQFIAIGLGKFVQIWQMPSPQCREFVPLIMHRTYSGQADAVVHVSWSSDSSVICGASQDGTARIWSVHTTLGFEPFTLSGGHKAALLAAHLVHTKTTSSNNNNNIGEQLIESCYTISEDGAICQWQCQYSNKGAKKSYKKTGEDDEAVGFFTGVLNPTLTATKNSHGHKSQAHALVKAKWLRKSRHFFQQDNATMTTCSFSERASLLVAGFSSGLFGIYELPAMSNLYTLSVGGHHEIISASTINRSGDWLALGCPLSQQLLVWEWQSETYVLKQAGHGYGMRCMAYSPDGICICTGGEDGKLKVWNATSGVCYVTLKSTHAAPITAVEFAKPSVILSAGLDGTVRAHDLHRYRTFKTFVTPSPVQFLSLAVQDQIVAAGSTSPFHVYLWNLQTAQLLDILHGHDGPVCGLSFSSHVLASASWDGTVRLWDIYQANGGGGAGMETLQHNADVVCVAFRPDGNEVCTSTLRGLLSFWHVEDAKLKYEIDGQKDISGGRKINDRMTANNNAASRYFTSVCYSADGAFVLAGGNSKYVCIYEVSQQILIKRFQISHNRSLDGVLDKLHSKNLTDGGPIDEEEDGGDDGVYKKIALPGARRGDDGSRKSRVEVLTTQVAFSSTGREWAAVTGEGLLVYSLDEDMLFDPIDLTLEMTPQQIQRKLVVKEYGTALKMALHLNEDALIEQVVESIPSARIPFVVRGLGSQHLERTLRYLSTRVHVSPHIEFYLTWCVEMLQTHGVHMEKHRSSFMRVFRALHKAVQMRHDELKKICNDNKYTLAFIQSQSQLLLNQEESRRRQEEKE